VTRPTFHCERAAVTAPRRPTPKTVRSLLDQALGLNVRAVLGDDRAQVIDVTHDSLQVVAGSLFCAVAGAVADGHRFVPQAVSAGATAVLVEHRVDADVTQIVVADSRKAMGPLAAAFHDFPSSSMRVVAVTGTNGKTTTCHLLSAIFEAHGWPSAVIGTLSGVRTTPEAPDLQRRLAELRDSGVEAVAMEATSIGLELHRLGGTTVSSAIFTNLSRDHLDIHQTMERYFAAKAMLFEPTLSKRAVVNADDTYGRLLFDAALIATDRFSLTDATNLVLGPAWSSFAWRGSAIRLALGGEFNVMNALGAATAAAALGITPETIARALSEVHSPPGRFESVDAGQNFTVLVDYAHTPDALAAVLRAVRTSTEGQVIIVFGCGGDRDATKRPLMGSVASEQADVVILTTDNPRSEDPDAIISAVMSGIDTSRRAKVTVQSDRRRAIETALGVAQAGDAVVIAGKGHETTQSIAGADYDFDDRVVARHALVARAGAPSDGSTQ
jgi:UDP-N-acetylmuramoyl-L-alanyl-D-glutamate--2,6-diaminopimelate ligase